MPRLARLNILICIYFLIFQILFLGIVNDFLLVYIVLGLLGYMYAQMFLSTL
jgi:hypothetical protein